MFDYKLFLSALFGWPLAKGALLTLVLSVLVMAVALAVSLATAALATSKRRWIRLLIAAFVWLFRGAPALLVLLFIWNGLPQISAVFRSSWFTPFIAAFLALTLIQIAYLTEILRSSYASIGEGQ